MTLNDPKLTATSEQSTAVEPNRALQTDDIRIEQAKFETLLSRAMEILDHRARSTTAPKA